ncbi:NAD(+)--dinitrogen-reductase ADP-D-ribosyltransferase [Denitromonas iodatirespirans]|uniref:NAD(+)--dinitrogen-reductase ADP-D-ribosyltransferase n=1 Tax=Denitromonas iodatirespirans TaxID=2795389 RepID=A0A944HAF3_DENI1|nr:NAD(+)--dinitrogen-reductase ADP-D-ribosyltransferase [Denitromonas iodatirespirans]MBT0960517.1 NAD(+)--dinitrogen-reductase ADP-D-ribosyltransferase [Denitromonas iodatirespirans]
MQKENSPVSPGAARSDKTPTPCRGTDKSTLPRDARLPINRCNLPAVILGSLTYQRHPAPLRIDGVEQLHRDLFRRLDAAPPAARADVFRDYMTVVFRLQHPEDIGYTGNTGREGHGGRIRATWDRLLRGWSFDADRQEGAVLKAWVESRFGLVPRFHGAPLRDPNGEAYRRYQEMRARGLYGTNALEAQLDLVYAFCQHAQASRHRATRSITLYRGINQLADHEVLDTGANGHRRVLLNNLNSFTDNRDRAGEFGDYILTADIPVPKLLFHDGLMPGVLQGEGEYLVIGGVIEAKITTW